MQNNYAKYAKKMQNICKNVQCPQNYVSFVFICIYIQKKMQKKCKICKHEMHVQNVQKKLLMSRMNTPLVQVCIYDSEHKAKQV